MVIKNSDSNEMIADLIEKSKVLSNKGKNIESEKLLKKALKLDSERIETIHQLSLVLKNQKKFSEYLKLWNEDITIKNKSHKYFHLADAHYNLNDMKKALSYINKAIQGKKISSNYNLKSKILLKLGKYDESLVEIDNAIEIKPGSVNHFLQKGNIFRKQKKYPIALEYFNKANELDDSSNSILEIVSTLEKLGQKNNALKKIEKELKKKPDEPLLLNAKAGIQRSMGKYKEAIKTVKKVISIYPNRVFVKRNLARVYVDNKNFKEAITILSDLKKTNYESTVILLLADAYQGIKNKTKAISLLKEAHKKLPNDSKIILGLLTIYLNLKNFKQSEIYVNKYLKLNPKDSQIYSIMGLIYRHFKNNKKSLELFNKSLALDPENNDTLYDIACIKSVEGQKDNALTLLEIIVIRDQKYKKMAKDDPDFKSLKNDQRFKKIIK